MNRINNSLYILATVGLFTLGFQFAGVMNAQSSPYKPLDSFLRPAHYVQITPFGSDYHPGGFAVSCSKKIVTYKGLPKGVSYPEASHQPAEFAATDGAKSTTFGGLASFLSNAMKLKFNGKVEGSLELKELTASNEYIRDENEMLSNPVVEALVKDYLSRGCEVYVVMSVLTTKALQVATTSTIGGSIQVNGNDLPECKSVPSPGSTARTSTEANPDVASSQHATSTEAASNPSGGVKLPKIGNASKVADATAGAVGAATPAYGVYGCRASANKITLATDMPVAIAMQMNQIRITTANQPKADPNPALKLPNLTNKIGDVPSPATQPGVNDQITPPQL